MRIVSLNLISREGGPPQESPGFPNLDFDKPEPGTVHGQYIRTLTDWSGMLITPPAQINVDLHAGGDVGVRIFLSIQAPSIAAPPTLIWGLQGGILDCRVRIYCTSTVPGSGLLWRTWETLRIAWFRSGGIGVSGPVGPGLGFDSSRQFTHSSRPVHASVHAPVHACKKRDGIVIHITYK